MLAHTRQLGLLFSSVIHFLPLLGNAQLCTGSFGDPVVKLTFDQASTIGSSSYVPPNAYTYTTTSCPNDGYYTITNQTAECFGSTWLTVTADHTGGGNFMLVNASSSREIFLSVQWLIYVPIRRMSFPPGCSTSWSHSFQASVPISHFVSRSLTVQSLQVLIQETSP